MAVIDQAEQRKTINVTGLWSLAQLYMQQFGGLTFGVITCLLLWVGIASPLLERNAVTIEAHRALLEELHRHSADQKDISQHLKTTAEILDRITLRLDAK